MKGRILPLDDVAEYGKTDHVILTLSLSPDEARQILAAFHAETVEDYEGARKERSLPVRLLAGYLSVIAEPERRTWNQDVSNTDSRWLAAANVQANLRGRKPGAPSIY